MKQKAFILEVYVSNSNKTTFLLREMVSGGTRPLCATDLLSDIDMVVSDSVSSMIAPKEDNQ